MHILKYIYIQTKNLFDIYALLYVIVLYLLLMKHVCITTSKQKHYCTVYELVFVIIDNKFFKTFEKF